MVSTDFEGIGYCENDRGSDDQVSVDRAMVGNRAPRILAVANQKGGVGKTTTTINLATALAAVGKNTIVFDLDPQGNASTGLGIAPKERNYSSFDVLAGQCSISDARKSTIVPGLDIVPSSMDLLGFEIELASHQDRVTKLANALTQLQNGPQDGPQDGQVGCDYVIIDCPPSLNLLTINALTACNAVIVPMQCEFFALEGLSQLLNTVSLVQRSTNPALVIQGIVLTMSDRRNRLTEQVEDDVRSTMGDVVYKTVIPRNVRLSEAPSFGKPALIYNFRCAGSQAYVRLATEVIGREQVLISDQQNLLSAPTLAHNETGTLQSGTLQSETLQSGTLQSETLQSGTLQSGTLENGALLKSTTLLKSA